MSDLRIFECSSCGKEWQEPYGTGRPLACYKCGSHDIHRIDDGRGQRRGDGYGRGA